MSTRPVSAAIARLLAAASALLLAGCVFSLHPFYTDESVIFAPELVGKWVVDTAVKSPEHVAIGSTWEFTRDDNAYTLVVTEANSGKQGFFRAQLFVIDGEKFLDLFPLKPDDAPQSEYYLDHQLLVHSVMHVVRLEPSLLLRVPNPDWFEKFVADAPAAVAHVRVKDSWAIKGKRRPSERIILSGPPVELQAFLRRIVRTDEAWMPTDPLRRQMPAQ